jgi:hypothetical protein
MTDDFETHPIGTTKKLEQIRRMVALQSKFMVDLDEMMTKLGEELQEILDEA